MEGDDQPHVAGSWSKPRNTLHIFVQGEPFASLCSHTPHKDRSAELGTGDIIPAPRGVYRVTTKHLQVEMRLSPAPEGAPHQLGMGFLSSQRGGGLFQPELFCDSMPQPPASHQG